jgi:hypothetical protein
MNVFDALTARVFFYMHVLELRIYDAVFTQSQFRFPMVLNKYIYSTKIAIAKKKLLLMTIEIKKINYQAVRMAMKKFHGRFVDRVSIFLVVVAFITTISLYRAFMFLPTSTHIYIFFLSEQCVSF